MQLKQYLTAIPLSFYDKKIYRDAVRNWPGRGLRYLLLVSLCTSLIFILNVMWEIGKASPARYKDAIVQFVLSEPDLSFDENINRFVNIFSQIPPISMQDGKFKVEAQQPYSITDPFTGYDIAIIDTTGKHKSLEGTDALLLLDENRIHIRNGEDKTEVLYLSNFQKDYNLDEEALNDTLFILGQIPAFGLHEGRFVTDGGQLYKIYDRKGRQLAEIGPGAKLGEAVEPLIAINNDEITYRSPFGKVGTIKATELNEDTFSAMVESAIRNGKNLILLMMPLLALPFVTLTSFIFSAVTLVFYALIAYYYLKLSVPGEYTYKQMMRLAAVAMTPVLFMSIVLPNLIPSQGIIYFLVGVGYLYYAIKSVTQK